MLGVRVMAEVSRRDDLQLCGGSCRFTCSARRRARFLSAPWFALEFRALLSGLTLGLSSSCLLGALGLSKAQAIYGNRSRDAGRQRGGGAGAEMAVAAAVFGLPTMLMGATFSHLVQAARETQAASGVRCR